MVSAMIQDAEDRTFHSGRPWNEISSEDGSFTLEVDFYTQTSWSFNRSPGLDTEKGFQVDTARFTFEGTVVDPSWSYLTRVLFGPSGDSSVQFAIIEKNLGSGFSMQLGLIAPPFTLEEAINDNETLGVSLSFTAGQWDPQSVPGITWAWTSDDLRGWFTYADAWGGGQNTWIGNQRQTIVGRGEWKPFGDWNSLYHFNPYPDSTVPGMLVGLGASHGWGTAAIGTSQEYSGNDTRISADLSLQRPGLGGMATISWQSDVPGSPLEGGGERLAIVSQVGWFLNPKFELYGRGEWGRPLGVDVDDLASFTFGASWMPRSNRQVKFSVEYMRMWGDSRFWALDGDSGIRLIDDPQSIVRAQLQVSF